ncbi:Proline rich transmembrane protein 1B [Geodia barretti]|uniref:Proline rich transmembrane protein 1B n=1 Tax=Geodia barretti TaxID=519541 RepID=A0AA35TGL2_GEOBA|nr:Proline rich transmembrane protein 1B [Geodia barretti]
MAKLCNSYPPLTVVGNRVLQAETDAQKTPVAVHLYQQGTHGYGGITSPITTQPEKKGEKRPVLPKINIFPKKPDNYRWYSLFVLFCSCFLCGLVALIYSFKVDEAYKRGDIVAARSASERARKWSYFGVLCGIMDFVIMAAIWLIILYGVWRIQQ